MNGDLVLMITHKQKALARTRYYEQQAEKAVEGANSLQGLGPSDAGKLPTVVEDRGSSVAFGYRK